MSFWQLTQVIGSPPQSDLFGVPTEYLRKWGRKSFLRGNSLKPIGSIFQKLLHGRRNVARLWQDYVLEFRLVRAEGIHRRNSPDWGFQILKEFIRNARRDFRAISPARSEEHTSELQSPCN